MGCRDFRRILPAGKTPFPFRPRGNRGVRSVVVSDDIGRQRLLRLHRVRWWSRETVDVVLRSVGEEREPFRHQVVRNAHRLIELFLRQFAHSDVVAQAFAHAAHTIKAAQYGQRDADLRLLPGLLL